VIVMLVAWGQASAPSCTFKNFKVVCKAGMPLRPRMLPVSDEMAAFTAHTC
jgi:hypothetical protein